MTKVGRPPDAVKKLPVLIRFDPEILRRLDKAPGRDRGLKIHDILKRHFDAQREEDSS
jgi:hypothetical protein